MVMSWPKEGGVSVGESSAENHLGLQSELGALRVGWDHVGDASPGTGTSSLGSCTSRAV